MLGSRKQSTIQQRLHTAARKLPFVGFPISTRCSGRVGLQLHSLSLIPNNAPKMVKSREIPSPLYKHAIVNFSVQFSLYGRRGCASQIGLGVMLHETGLV